MSNESESFPYTYGNLGFLKLANFPFHDTYFVPGLIETKNEIIVLQALSQINNFAERRYLDTILGLSRPAITVLVNMMISRGLIEQKPNPKDKRGYILSLTDIGKGIAKWMIIKKQYLDSIQLKGFKKEEIVLFNSMLTRMAQNVLDMSERELMNIPKYEEALKMDDVKLPEFISKDDQTLFIRFAKKVENYKNK